KGERKTGKRNMIFTAGTKTRCQFCRRIFAEKRHYESHILDSKRCSFKAAEEGLIKLCSVCEQYECKWHDGGENRADEAMDLRKGITKLKMENRKSKMTWAVGNDARHMIVSFVLSNSM